jgi:hypothetical protein
MLLTLITTHHYGNTKHTTMEWWYILILCRHMGCGCGAADTQHTTMEWWFILEVPLTNNIPLRSGGTFSSGVRFRCIVY